MYTVYVELKKEKGGCRKHNSFKNAVCLLCWQPDPAAEPKCGDAALSRLLHAL
jgi:hypothetical protein